MKTLSTPAAWSLRVHYRLSRSKSIDEALRPYGPVGWCGAVQKRDRAPKFFFDGFSVLPGTKVCEDTIFRVASISKILTGAAAMLLVKRGKLSLDDDVSEVLRIHVNKKITLRQLLTHTSSLTDRKAYNRAIETQKIPPLDQMLDESFMSLAAGTRFHYSNLGAGVVGMAVEAATDVLFDDFVRKEFFEPFGIDASFHPQRIQNQARMANCYRVPGKRLSYDAIQIASTPTDDAPDPLHHYLVPAGKLMISAPSLLRVLQHISSEMPELFVLQNQVGSVRCDSGRGLGVSYMPRGILSDHAYWGHQGTAYGALCEAWLCRDTGTIAVLLTNGVALPTFSPLYRAGQAGMVALLRD